MKIDIFGALFTLSFNLIRLNSQCTEGTKYVNIHLRTSIALLWIIIYDVSILPFTDLANFNV